MRVLMLCGGRSAEREISLESAVFVRSVLEMEGSGHTVRTVEIDGSGGWTMDGEPLSMDTGGGRWRLLRAAGEIGFDIVFPVLHGPYGEDGTVQGLCETAGWPCAGADVLGSALAMNKDTCKRLLAGAGIRVVPWQAFRAPFEGAVDSVEEVTGFPCFVKPARLGSSVGISRVPSASGLPAALELASGFDPLVIVEREVPGAREIEVSVTGDSSGIDVSVPGEIEPGREWYDYQAKYQCSDSRLVIPANLDRSVLHELTRAARESFRLIGGRGYARVDFLLSRGGELYLNELNTIPGFTEISMFPKLWEASGIPVGDVLDRIMNEALSRVPVGLADGGSR
jgi:D-alanine-D-alanine ligase